ncbi:MAG TPA: M56 family metallopeptidase, partial [Candidatus Baltobacteraceae bacterium]|nr:M56 family metallopeptidase [Candidatus Baltobacteraceae bacterium]
MIVTFVVNSLWQGLVAVTLTALVLRLVPPRDAATRYAAWFLTLAAAVAIPALAMWTHVGSQIAAALPHRGGTSGGTFTLTFAGTLTSGSANPLLERVVALLWIAGAAIGLGRLAMSAYRIKRLLARATPYSTVDGVAVLSSPDLAIPIATGISSPAIVLPEELTAALGSDDLRCTIEHELAHVRRGDVAANAIQRVVEAIFFWNPCVQLAGRRLSAEREAACDDRAALRIGEPREYALCLAALGRRIAERTAPLLTPGAFGSRNALVARIERLMSDGSPTSRINYLALGGVFMLFA